MDLDCGVEFARLVLPHRARMQRVIWGVLRDADLSEDALQDALVILWRKLRVLRHHPNPEAFVLRVSIDAARDQWRARRRRDARARPLEAVRRTLAPGDDLATDPVEQAETRIAVLAATLLLACGLGLQAAPGANTVAGPLADLSATWRLTAAMRGARSLRCGPAADAWLVTPATAAEHVFRELVPIRARRHADGRTVYEFKSVGDATRYEFVSGEGNGLPREVRSSPGPLHSGGVAPEETVVTCRWETAPTRGAIAWMGGR